VRKGGRSNLANWGSPVPTSSWKKSSSNQAIGGPAFSPCCMGKGVWGMEDLEFHVYTKFHAVFYYLPLLTLLG